MRTTISIHLAGNVFHIEEEACETLKSYLAAVKMRLPEAEREEIIQDVESRLAELLISKRQSVISVENLQELMQILGKPEDFGANPQDFSEAKTNTEPIQKVNIGGLRRLRYDKKLAGVASGLALHFGLQVFLLRILFFITAFFYGSGFWVYLVLWIFIPKTKSLAEEMALQQEQKHKMHHEFSPEHTNITPVKITWARLLIGGLLLLLGFSSMTGLFFMVETQHTGQILVSNIALKSNCVIPGLSNISFLLAYMGKIIGAIPVFVMILCGLHVLGIKESITKSYMRYALFLFLGLILCMIAMVAYVAIFGFYCIKING